MKNNVSRVRAATRGFLNHAGRGAAAVGLLLAAGAAPAAELKVLLPLARQAYQTNEPILVSILRSDAQALAAGTMQVTLSGTDASKLSFSFAVPAVSVTGKSASATEHLALNGWLLRPGKYEVTAAADGASATAAIEVYSHIRKSSFTILGWGSRATNEQLPTMGEDSLGYNLIYGNGVGDGSVRGGVDFTGVCIMSGGHQMDLRMECDWSDPYVLGGGTARVTAAALQFRTNPNAVGVHFYDEPGLTWAKDPVTGELTAHGVPPQVRSYEAAFGKKPLHYKEIKAEEAASVAQWTQWATWKLGFMDAAWRDAKFGVSYVRPDFLSLTQSQYGFTAFTDGYYFNVTRSLPVASGHGGYDDWGPGYFNPSWTLEVARARDLARPCWYLPTWYGNTPADRFRLEQYLSFMTGIQGMGTPPDLHVQTPEKCSASEGIVESNKAMARLGTIFTTMPVTRPPVAMLYSLSHIIRTQTRNPSLFYAHSDTHMATLGHVYIAGKLIHNPFLAVLDEDIIDGTLAAHHKAVIIPSVTYLDPAVIIALEDFIVKGGSVLLTDDCTVTIKGAEKIGAMPDTSYQKKFEELSKKAQAMTDKEAQKVAMAEAGKYYTVGTVYKAAMPLAKGLEAKLKAKGIQPVAQVSNPEVIAGRQAYGDVEYTFLVNAKYGDKEGALNSIAGTESGVKLTEDSRPIYDALIGGPVAEFKGKTAGEFRFGPGQMRVFARTARPIAAVQVATPEIVRDYTLGQKPITLNLSATITDAAGRIVSGSMPLRIRVVDALGMTRYDLYRATTLGTCTLSLPLGANDPAGVWTVEITELLNNTIGTATLTVSAPNRNGMLAGSVRRAVVFGNDLDNVFRFCRVNRSITIVKGTSEYNGPAAERLVTVLKPWGVTATVVAAAEVNKPIELTAEQAQTFCGMTYAGSGQVKAGRGNSPLLVGYDVPGAVVLLGTPEDNPLIKAVLDKKVLPFAPKAGEMPGVGRGLLAWQLGIIRMNTESVTLIAHDAAGMAEAVGSFYEAAAGLEPLTPNAMPQNSEILAASKSTAAAPEAKILWQAALPDRAVAMVVENGSLRVFTNDGSVSTLSAAGKVEKQKAMDLKDVPAQPATAAIPEAAKAKLAPYRLVKKAVAGNQTLAVGFWGGTLQVFDAAGQLKFQQLLPQDISGMAWLGDTLAVGLADGRVLGLAVK